VMPGWRKQASCDRRFFRLANPSSDYRKIRQGFALGTPQNDF